MNAALADCYLNFRFAPLPGKLTTIIK